MNKEQVYDAEISPLMAQIIAICKRAGISCLCTFDIATEENDGCMCTTCLPDENGEFPEKIKEAEHVIYRKPEFFAFTITSPCPAVPDPAPVGTIGATGAGVCRPASEATGSDETQSAPPK